MTSAKTRAILISILLISASLAGCGGKVKTSLAGGFNSISARSDRIARIYCPAAIDALPIVAVELKWSEEEVNDARAIIKTIEDTAASIHQSLGDLVDTAISADQRLLIGPLLKVIADEAAKLDGLGLFKQVGVSTGVETGIRIAVLALQTTARLLPAAPK